MAITVLSEPGYLSLSKNPCEFHLRTNDWITQIPVAGIYEMTFTTKLTTVGSVLTLSWNGNTVQFTVEASATDATGYNLPDDIAATSLGQYVSALADEWFSAQYLLQKDFIIESVIGGIVRFTARQPGTEFELTYTTDIPSGEAVFSTDTAAVDRITLQDYSVLMDVEVEETYGSGEFTRIGTLQGLPVVTGSLVTNKADIKIDVQELLDGFLQNRHDFPDLTETVPTIADNTNLQWRAIYAEQYTDSGEVKVVRRVQTDDKRVLKGGLNYLDVPALPDLETDFYGVTDKPFNTWQPDVKEVTAAEQHYLYFLTDHALVNPSRFHMRAEVYYTDGTTDTTTVLSGDVQQQFETYYYRSGFNDSGLDALQPSKTPYKYTLYVDETLGAITTKVYTFWLVDETREDRYFLFENSMQGVETLRTNGKHIAIANVSKTESADMVQAGYLATDAVVKQKTESYSDTFEVFTGFKPREELVQLREFLRTEKAFEIIDGNLVPIVIDGGTFDMEQTQTGNYAYGLQFRYRHAFVNKGYSNA